MKQIYTYLGKHFLHKTFSCLALKLVPMLLKFTRTYYKYKCRHWIIVDLFNRSNFLQTRGTHLKFTDIKNLLENLSRAPHLHFEVICLCIIICYSHIWIINPLKGDDHASLLPNFNSKIDNPLQEYFDNFVFAVKVWKKKIDIYFLKKIVRKIWYYSIIKFLCPS